MVEPTAELWRAHMARIEAGASTYSPPVVFVPDWFRQRFGGVDPKLDEVLARTGRYPNRPEGSPS